MPKQQQSLMKLNPADNVAVALRPVAGGEALCPDGKPIVAAEHIPQGHKIALVPIAAGENVIKYGQPIGHATEGIAPGSHVHTHNLATNLSGELEYRYSPAALPTPPPRPSLLFNGYRRKNGGVGVRNDLYLIPTVGCVNATAQQMVQAYRAANPGRLERVFDNVTVLGHAYGCSQLGDDHANTRAALAGAALHPNAGGVLVVGLGCENNTMEQFVARLGPVDEERIKFLVVQDVQDEIAEGARLIGELCRAAEQDAREPVPLSELKVGLKCGGSDGLSGITANPLLGRFSDFLVAQGGSAVLTEVPEMFGAEQSLMARAESEEVFGQIVELVNGFKRYFSSYGEPVYENPSPGNKAGGISTLEDKSLGCTQKSGSSAVVDVLAYGERIRKKGLSLLQAPGNDLVASSALACAGCQLVLFSTGRGTPFGSFVPTVKLSTNSALFQKKPHWIDFDAGRLLEEGMEAVLEQFIAKVLAVAGGEAAKNEANGFREIAIFKTGVTL